MDNGHPDPMLQLKPPNQWNPELASIKAIIEAERAKPAVAAGAASSSSTNVPESSGQHGAPAPTSGDPAPTSGGPN